MTSQNAGPGSEACGIPRWMYPRCLRTISCAVCPQMLGNCSTNQDLETVVTQRSIPKVLSGQGKPIWNTPPPSSTIWFAVCAHLLEICSNNQRPGNGIQRSATKSYLDLASITTGVCTIFEINSRSDNIDTLLKIDWHISAKTLEDSLHNG